MFPPAAFISKRQKDNCRHFSTLWIASQSFVLLFWKRFLTQVRFWHLSPQAANPMAAQEQPQSLVLLRGTHGDHRPSRGTTSVRAKALAMSWCFGQSKHLHPKWIWKPQANLFSFSADRRCIVTIMNEEQREGEWEPENGKMKDLNWYMNSHISIVLQWNWLRSWDFIAFV